MGFFDSVRNLFSYGVRERPDLAFPETAHRQSALSHVGILRLVKRHAPSLPCIKIRKLVWISVPIVTIELDYDAMGRDKRIYDELLKKERLFLVYNFHLIKDSVTGKFKFVRAERLLENIHREQSFPNSRIVVAAFNRTVRRIRLLCAGLRKAVLLSAHGTNKLKFISALPLIKTIHRAEPSIIQTGRINIKFLATPLASTIVPRLSVIASRCFTAFCRTKPMLVIRRLKFPSAVFAITQREPRSNALAFTGTKTSAVLRPSGWTVLPLKLLPAYFANSGYLWHEPSISNCVRTIKEMVVT